MIPYLPRKRVGGSFVLKANATANTQFQNFSKPTNATMLHFLLVGMGGGGGTGVIGANSTAAGGGGGGSGSQSSLLIAADLLPDSLYYCLGVGTTAAGFASRISIQPDTVTNHCLLIANAGGVGGNAVGSTAGAAGAAGTVGGLATSPLAGMGVPNYLAGQSGIIGGTNVAGAALTLPVTGLIVTGAPGGGGLPAAAATGTNGGSFTTPASYLFPAQPGGVGPSVATNPAGLGADGIFNFNGINYYYGGSGSSSTHGTATTTGLVQARGGDGAPGCGGGGMGGALTGSTAATQSKGGSAFCIVIWW